MPDSLRTKLDYGMNMTIRICIPEDRQWWEEIEQAVEENGNIEEWK